MDVLIHDLTLYHAGTGTDIGNYILFPLFGNGTNIQMVTVLRALYSDQADSTEFD